MADGDLGKTVEIGRAHKTPYGQWMWLGFLLANILVALYAFPYSTLMIPVTIIWGMLLVDRQDKRDVKQASISRQKAVVLQKTTHLVVPLSARCLYCKHRKTRSGHVASRAALHSKKRKCVEMSPMIGSGRQVQLRPRTAGAVELAIRHGVKAGDVLLTPTRGKPFTVARLDENGVVLLLGAQQAWTAIAWPVLEGVVELLAGGHWMTIGGVYDTTGHVGTLDSYLKNYTKRATAGWVAAVLEQAGVADIDRGRPSRLRLRTSRAPDPPNGEVRLARA